MPDIAPFAYVIDLLTQIGPTEVTWQDISNWRSITGIELSAWESSTIKRLSAIYTSCAQRYQDSVSPSPYRSIEAPRPVDDAIKAALREGNFRK